MLGIIAVGHLSVLWHAVQVTHAVCPHGGIVDASSGRPGGHHRDPPSRGPMGDSHDGCTYLLSFTSVNKLVTTDVITPAPGLVPVSFIRNLLPARIESKTRLFRLSPSQSPPPGD